MASHVPSLISPASREKVAHARRDQQHRSRQPHPQESTTPFGPLLPKLSAEPHQQDETEQQRPCVADRIGSACEADDAGKRQDCHDDEDRRTKCSRRRDGHAHMPTRTWRAARRSLRAAPPDSSGVIRAALGLVAAVGLIADLPILGGAVGGRCNGWLDRETVAS